MTLSMIFAFLWMFAANVMAMLPSRDSHWRRAYILMATALPMLAFVFYEHSLWIGLLVMAAVVSVLRWPARYLLRWMHGKVTAVSS